MKRICIAAILAIASLVAAQAQTQAPAFDTPSLEYVMQLNVSLGEAYQVGATSYGFRNVIPITGGTFEGPKLKGTIVPGGADWQLIENGTGRTNVEAIYSIKTDDGAYIHVRNNGIISSGKDENGNPTFYFRCAPKFEAPADSNYDWMNKALFVCAPDFSGPQGTITLRVWMVK